VEKEVAALYLMRWRVEEKTEEEQEEEQGSGEHKKNGRFQINFETASPVLLCR
jgi:hypothetical protein